MSKLRLWAFPLALRQLISTGVEFDENGSRRRSVLYIAGNNFETTAAKLIYEAFGESNDLLLRVRPHPRKGQNKIGNRMSYSDG